MQQSVVELIYALTRRVQTLLGKVGVHSRVSEGVCVCLLLRAGYFMHMQNTTNMYLLTTVIMNIH